MSLDTLTKNAISHSLHCLVGCGIGEIVGMVVASSLGWDKFERVILAVCLAFIFGYALTYRGVRRNTSTTREAIKITAATDTASITTMELIANIIEFTIPGALMATIASPLFWISLIISMSIAFVLTVPVNRFMMSSYPHHHAH